MVGHQSGIIGFDAVEPEQQNIAQGDFVIVYSALETTSGARLNVFTGLGRTAGIPGQMPEGPGATNRQISLFSTFDLPFARIQIELAYPSALPRSREKTVFNVDASDFDATGFQKGKIHRKWPSPVNRSGQLKDQSLIDRSMTSLSSTPLNIPRSANYRLRLN